MLGTQYAFSKPSREAVMKILQQWCARLVAAVMVLACPMGVIAQAYPGKPLLLVVPYAAGGVTDGLARMVAQQLATRLGQAVTVENKPGAMGQVGFEQVAKSAPDGYTLVLGNIGIFPGTAGQATPLVDLQRDFVPVSLLAQMPVVLIVDSSIPANSAKELLDYAAARPGQVAYGTSETGSPSHRAGEQFRQDTKTTMTRVPFRTDAATLTALASDNVKVAFATLDGVAFFKPKEKIRALAVTGNHRSPLAPGVPTFAEAGIKGVDALSQYAVLLPRGTPQDIVATLHKELKAIVQSPAFQSQIADYGIETVGSSPQELAALLETSRASAQWAAVVKDGAEPSADQPKAAPATPVVTAPIVVPPPPKPAAMPMPSPVPAQPIQVESYKVVKVFFGTDRKLVSSASSPRDFFASDRGGAISYGNCEVSIPRDHKIGELETPSFLRRYFENPAKHVVLLRLNLRSRNEFMSDLNSTIAEKKTNSALVFVHGYNNTFEDAARRTAQIAHDIEFPGVPMFYSWPSNGATLSYVTDGNDAEQAIMYLKAFLKDLAINSKFTSITLLAHSMGNRVLTQAFAALKNDISATKLRVFKEIILAAPDIDADVFKNNIAPALVASKASVTLYASSRDGALAAAKKINGGPRAGDSEGGLVVVKGIETIDATNVDTNLFWGLGHAYVADSRNILSDLSYLIVKGLSAPARYGLETVPDPSGTPYWKFRN
ncbi:MAG: alpha/beta hydrolase [Burkholderiales bacterium]|nr:alpha/beta hydrolase [Burkholderiales bacterium]